MQTHLMKLCALQAMVGMQTAGTVQTLMTLSLLNSFWNKKPGRRSVLGLDYEHHSTPLLMTAVQGMTIQQSLRSLQSVLKLLLSVLQACHESLRLRRHC